MTRGSRLFALLIAALGIMLTAGPARADIVVGGGDDTTSPTIGSVALASGASTTVDISTSNAAVDFVVDASDVGGGIDRILLQLTDPATNRTLIASGAGLMSGDFNDGTFMVTLRLYAGLDTTGTYQLTGCQIADRAGNMTPTDGWGTCPPNDVPTITVEGHPDTTAPTISSVALAPGAHTTVDVSTSNAAIDFVVHASDTGVGIDRIYLQFTDPESGRTLTAGGAGLMAGTFNDGTFMTILRLYAGQDIAGSYVLTGCQIADSAGNQVPANAWGSCPENDVPMLTVRSAADTTAPTISSVALAPGATATVDASVTDAAIDFVVHASDTGVGVVDILLLFTDPSTGRTLVADGAGLMSGTFNDGTFMTVLRLHAGRNTAGTYALTGCQVVDGVGNRAPADGWGPCPTNDVSIGVVGDEGSRADLALANTVSPAEALPGDTVTYTLTATNGAGAGDATGTAVTDVLPAGVTFLDASDGCTNDAGTVRCELGTVAAGSSRTATIRATVDPMPMHVDPNTAHQVLEQKAETDLRVERGETRTATATCPSGYFATDGGIRLDAVDQGGDVARTSVPASGATADGTGWTATLTNDNPGAALAKVTVACLARTTVTGEHQHDVLSTTATAADQPLAPGATTVTVDCAPGQTPFAPSYDVGPGARVTASRADGSSWTFEVEAANARTGDFSVGCLDPRTTSANGHYHVLGIEQRSQTVTVPAGQTVETQLTCADEAKGIVASRRVDAGLVDRGTDPRAKIRAFRFTNPTTSALTADLGLTCLDIRTSGEPVSTRIRNTATVTTTAADTTTADDSATATFTAYGDGWAILPTGTAAVGSHGRSVSVPLRCASACSVSARITGAGGTVLGSGRAHAAAGATARLTVRTTKAGAKALAGHRVTRATVVVRTSDGATYSRVVRLHR